MLSAVQHQILQLFLQLTYTYSPSYDGGFLNYIFSRQYDSVRQNYALDFIGDKLNGRDMKQEIIDFIVEGTKNLEVYEVIKSPEDPSDIQSAHYLGALIAGAVVTLVAIGMVIGMMVVIYHSMKHVSNKEFSGFWKICYFVLGAFILVFLLVTSCITCVTFVSMDALTQQLRMNYNENTDPSGAPPDDMPLHNSAVYMIDHAKLFLDDFIQSGRNESKRTITALQKTVKDELLIEAQIQLNDILDKFSVSFLISEARSAQKLVGSLQENIEILLRDVSTLLDGIIQFQTDMNKNIQDLKMVVDTVCQVPSPLQSILAECKITKDYLDNIDFKIDIRGIDKNMIAQMDQNFKAFAKNLQDAIAGVKKLEQSLMDLTPQIEDKISTIVDITKYLDNIDNLWVKVDNQYLQPLIYKMDQIKLNVKNYAEPISRIAPPVGFVCVAIVLAILVLAMAYYILCVIEAFKRDLIKGNGDPMNSGCPSPSRSVRNASIVFAFLCSFITLGILIACVIIPAAGLINNEVCRYLVEPRGRKLTDNALNLYVEQKWFKFLRNILGPRFISKIYQSPPANILSAITVTCDPNAPGYGYPGLLPRLGIKNLIHTQGILDDPELNKFLQDGRTELRKKIVTLNLFQYLPKNFQTFVNLVQDKIDELTNLDFQTPIEILQKPLLDTADLDAKLQKLDESTPQLKVLAVASGQSHANIRETMQQIPGLQQNAYKLAASLGVLQGQIKSAKSLTKLIKQVQETTKIAGDKEKMKSIITAAFDKTVIRFKISSNASLSKEFQTTTQNLFPCENLYRAAHVALHTVCYDTGVLNRLGSTSFLFVILWFILILSLLLLTIYFLMHRFAVFGLHEIRY